MSDLVRVGVLFPLGGHWRWGHDCVAAVRSALEAVAARTRLPRIELDVRDVADPAEAGSQAEGAIDAGARVLIGTVFSAPALAATEAAHRRGVPYWEAVAAATELTRRGHRALFRLNTTAEEYGRTAAAFARELAGPRARVAIAEHDEPFCRSIVSGFVAGLAAVGIVPSVRVAFPSGGADHEGVMERLRAADADVALLAALGPSVAALWGAAGRVGPPARAIVGNGAWATRPVIGGEEADLDGVYVVDTPHTGTVPERALTAAGLRQLRDRRGATGAERPGPADADMSCVAAELLFGEVLSRADPCDVEAFIAAARAIDVPRGGTLNGYGVRYDERGDNARAFAVVLRWDGGDRRIVYPPELATAPLRG